MAPMPMPTAMTFITTTFITTTFITTTFITTTFIMTISMSTATRAIIITLLIVTAPRAAITYYLLMAPVTSITGISYPIVIKVRIGPWAAANHFITAVQIVAAV